MNASSHDASALADFSSWYSSVHGYVSVVVCTFGICTNVFNITILTRRDMYTPTNIFLTWLAVSDILTMLPYVPFVIHFYCVSPVHEVSPEKNSYPWVIFFIVLISVVAVTHTVSIWLGVALAVFRCVQIRSTSSGPIARKIRIKQTKIVTLVIYIMSTLILIPNYLTNKIEIVEYEPVNGTIYTLQDLRLATNDTEPLVFFNVISYALLAKIIPCILMFVFGGILLCSLSLQSRQRRRRLSTKSIASGNKKAAKQARTTRMLLVVMILFQITELPQGVLILMSATIPGFFYDVYMPLGDMMDFIALLNNAINFVLYCIMSHQFRNRFIDMYLRKTYVFKHFEKISLRESMTRTSTLDGD